MADTYHYVRFKWWTRVDLSKISKELSPKFSVEMASLPSDKMEIALHKDERNELKVKSDTLIAYLSPFRAVLSQKQPSPLTSKDMELRKKIIELYPRERPTPFPWSFSKEPKFEIAGER